MKSLRIESKYNDLWLLILRIVASGMLLTHGFSKFQKLVGEGPKEFANPLGIGEIPTLVIAVVTEFICPILVILGFKTRWAALGAMATMLVIVFIFHWSHPFGKKELGLLYLLVFGSIFMTGAGKYSIDHALSK